MKAPFKLLALLIYTIALVCHQRAEAAYGARGTPVFANNSTGIVIYGSAVSGGDLEIVGGVIYPESSLVVPTAVDSLGNTCTLYSNTEDSPFGGQASWFYCPVTHAGTPTITVAGAGATTYQIQLSDYDGFTGTPTAVGADNISAFNPSTATISTGSFNSTDNNELMIGATYVNDTTLSTYPSGWTLNGSDTQYTNSFYQTVATSGTATSMTATLPGAGAWFASIQGFVGSGSATPIQGGFALSPSN